MAALTFTIVLTRGRGFFVEVGVDDSKGQAVVLRSFSHSGPLEDYAQRMWLPES